MSANEIRHSPDMGGKEGLSALGFSRTLKRNDREEWHFDTSEGMGVRVVFSFSFSENEWKCLTQLEHHGYAAPTFASATELNAIVGRLNELVEGDD